MKPFFKPGAVLFFKKVPCKQLKPGNVIVFRRSSDLKPVIHRIIKIDTIKESVVTRGDNCKFNDLPVDFSLILGKIIAKQNKSKISTISRNTEIIHKFIASVYLKIKIIFHRLLYFIFPAALSTFLIKDNILKKSENKNMINIFFFNKQIAVYKKGRYNSLYVYPLLLKQAEKLKNLIVSNKIMKTNFKPDNADIMFREEDSEGIIYNAKTGEIKILNETACVMYSLLKKHNSIETVVNKLISLYDIDKQKAQQEVQCFFDELVKRELI